MEETKLTVEETLQKIDECIQSAFKQIENAHKLSDNIKDSDLESSYEVTKFYAMRVHLNKAWLELERASENREALYKRKFN